MPDALSDSTEVDPTHEAATDPSYKIVILKLQKL